jgi:hypothetical protein
VPVRPNVCFKAGTNRLSRYLRPHKSLRKTETISHALQMNKENISALTFLSLVSFEDLEFNHRGPIQLRAGTYFFRKYCIARDCFSENVADDHSRARRNSNLFGADFEAEVGSDKGSQWQS